MRKLLALFLLFPLFAHAGDFPLGAVPGVVGPTLGAAAISPVISGVTPITGGATTQVCFNNGGFLSCGDAGLTFDPVLNILTVTGGITGVPSGSGTLNNLTMWTAAGTLGNASPAIVCDGTNCTAAGPILVAPGTAALPGLAATADSSDGFVFGDGAVTYFVDGQDTLGINAAGAVLGSNIQCYFLGNLNDSRICWEAAGAFQFGADAASPVAQSLNGADNSSSGAGGEITLQSGAALGTNQPGAHTRVLPGVPTGSGVVGAVVIGTTTVVASLPACAVGIRGGRATVTDGLTPAFMATVVGGGSVVTPVLCDGTNWIVG